MGDIRLTPEQSKKKYFRLNILAIFESHVILEKVSYEIPLNALLTEKTKTNRTSGVRVLKVPLALQFGKGGQPETYL